MGCRGFRVVSLARGREDVVKIVVTGADGFIGHHFVEHLLVSGERDIVAMCSFHHGGVGARFLKSPRISQAMADGAVRAVAVDLTHPYPAKLLDFVDGADAMVCFASRSHVDTSLVPDEAAQFFRDNSNIALAELEIARKVRPKVFVLISTDEVYGPAHVGQKHAEWSVIAPSNPYSASKAAQEAAAFAWWRAFGVPVVIINSMNIVGERQHPEKFLPMVMHKVASGERVKIHAVMGADGKWTIGSRHFIHARNLASAVMFILARHAGGGPRYRYGEVERPPRYHVAGEEMTNLELAQEVAAEMGMPLDYELFDAHSARPGHDLRYALDDSLIRGMGWSPPIQLRESIRRIVRWTMENPEWMEPRTFENG